MSGILGLWQRKGPPVSPECMEAMMRCLEYRGPDRQDVWCEKNVGLGHVLLCTTPEAQYEKQPLQSRDGRFVLTADARIDNRSELIRLLDLRGDADRNMSDADLLLAVYERWGEATPEKLVGDFAFAIWDAHRRQLFCARDAMGVRPFYYHNSSSLFVFASDVRVLLVHPNVPDTLNERQILAYLSGFNTDLSHTFYSSIQRLLPGSALLVTQDGEVREWQHWKPEETVRELRLSDDRAYEEGFREVFNLAMTSSLRSNTPVGIQLSGGLDSSAIAGVARRLRGSSLKEEPLHTYSAIFPSLSEMGGLRIDERPFIEEVVAGGGFTSHFVEADQISPLDNLANLVKLWGQPFALRGHYFIMRFLEEAQQEGIRVLLDGCEGDIVVGYGFEYFHELAEAGNWQLFESVANEFSRNTPNNPYLSTPQESFWRYGLEALLLHVKAGRWSRFFKEVDAIADSLNISRGILLQKVVLHLVLKPIKRIWQRHSKTNAAELVAPDLLIRAGLPEWSNGNGGGVSSSPRTDHARALQQNKILSGALDGIDPMFAGFHIEARHPFYDRRLMEYSLSLPMEQRFKGGWTRSIMRRSLRGVLPESIQGRQGKAMLGSNIARNILRYEGYYISELIQDPLLLNYVSQELAVQAHRKILDMPETKNVFAILRMAVLKEWLYFQEGDKAIRDMRA